MGNCNGSGGNGFGGTAERMMELGIGMSLAGQMSRMMNQTMADTMQTPPPAQNQAAGPQRLYYAAVDGKQAGPFSETELGRLINEKRITKDTLVWHQGITHWKPAQDVPEIMRILVLMPPPL